VTSSNALPHWQQQPHQPQPVVRSQQHPPNSPLPDVGERLNGRRGLDAGRGRLRPVDRPLLGHGRHLEILELRDGRRRAYSEARPSDGAHELRTTLPQRPGLR
jgi:hypothetical protein